MSRAISVRNLKKNFVRVSREPGLRGSLRSLVRRRVEAVPAVRGVSFDVQAGEKVAFIGPNGAGKSTTIKMLTGILHPSSGEASVLGFVPWTDRKKLVARIGCVFGQRSQLWYHLPVLETFRLLGRVYDLGESDSRERLDELVALFELEELLAQPVRKLSLGQRMRCEIAASLLHRREAVFLDEPTIGLDVVARRRVRDLLLRLNEQDGTTLFLTSHDAGDIEEVCERVLLIDDGRVMLDTSVRQLKAEHLRSALEYRAAFLVQAGFMFANNFLFLSFWAVFFHRFERAGGWGLKDVALLFGVCATSFGLCIVLLGGLMQLATRIEEGRLDSWLLRSRPLLWQAGTSRMSLAGFGDVASGLVLVLLSGNGTPERLAIFLLLTLVSVASFAAFVTIVHSQAFFVSRADTLAGSAVNGLLSFACYPPVLFGGWSKVLLFAVVPAGLITWLPAQLVREWSWSDAARLLVGSKLLWTVAALVWRTGLSRYESGNLTQAVEI